jgi:hypothetical protein
VGVGGSDRCGRHGATLKPQRDASRRRPMRLAAPSADSSVLPIPFPHPPFPHPSFHPSTHPSFHTATAGSARNLRTDGCRTGSVVSFPTVPPAL